MADENIEQETRGRRPMTDPRLQREGEELSALEIAALWAGWAAAAVLLGLLFWLAVDTSMTIWKWVVLGVDVGLAVFWAVVHRQSLMGATRARGVRLGANSVLFVVFVLGILVLINVIAARHHWRKDITESQQYSLSEQTRNVVSDLEQDVSIVAFLSQPEAPGLRDRLREYNMLSPQVELHIYDPLLDAEKATEYNVHSSTSDVIVIESGDREEKVYGGDEEQLTSTILAVTSGEKTRICFLTGHGELSLDEQGGGGLGTIKSSLENQQYQVDTLNLSTEEEPEVPGDCAVLVIAGPTEPIRQEEMDAISDYADQGGNLLMALEPGGPTLESLFEPYGVEVREGTVHDPSYGFLGSPEIPMASAAGSHRIVERLGRVALALPTTTALEIVETAPQQPQQPGMPPPSQQAEPLLETSGQASLVRAGGAEGEDTAMEPRGPFTLAAVIDAGKQQQPGPMGMPPEENENAPRMVVIGDADMMTDLLISRGLVGNARLVLNSINWLVENEKLISIPPKEDTPRYMTMNASQKRLVWALTIGIIPLGIGIVGFIVWWRRR